MSWYWPFGPTQQQQISTLQQQVLTLTNSVRVLTATQAATTKKVSTLMTAQDDINASAAALKAVVTDLTGTVQTLADEFAALQNAAGVPVDTSSLTTAVQSLQGVQAALDNLATANAPAPVVEDPPADTPPADA